MPTRPTPIVDAAFLHGTPEPVVICEVGSTMGGADPVAVFETGHLPGARFVSLEDDLSAAPGPIVGRHPLPTAGDFASALGRLGIDLDSTVVAYDRQGGGIAARLVWMLRILGQPAALLDGGIAAWGGPTEAGAGVEPEPSEVVERPWPRDAVADADDVVTGLAAGATVVDSRDAARYAGEHEPIDAIAGHVPGAVNLPFADNLHDGSFRSPDDLRVRFTPIIGPEVRDAADERVPVVYCGSGVTACHNALAIEHAGLGPVRVYVGSWSGWSTDPDRPVATGTAP